MKNKQGIFKKEKGAAVGLVMCFVAMIAIVGLITFSQYQQRTELEQQQLAEAETKDKTENKKAEDKEPSKTTNTDNIQAELPTVEPAPEKVFTPASSGSSALKFAANDVLLWPVDGNVVLSYSMDKPIYFSTLEQYKYNPAVIIAGEVGTEVLAAAEGRVTSIKTNAQTGITLTMDIGSGYEVVYGQLKDVCVAEGYHISKGDVIGYISEPTKYYSVEGANLYFQLLKDGEPVNPLEYLDA